MKEKTKQLQIDNNNGTFDFKQNKINIPYGLIIKACLRCQNLILEILRPLSFLPFCHYLQTVYDQIIYIILFQFLESKLSLYQMNTLNQERDQDRLLSQLDDYQAQYQLGNSQLKKNNKRKAVQHFKKAIQFKCDYAQAYFQLASIHEGENQLIQAEKLYKRAIELNPQYKRAHNNLGVIYYRLRKYNQAEICYRNSLQIDKNYKISHNNLGLLYMNRKDKRSAQQEFRKALQIDPQYKQSLLSLGYLLLSQNRLKEAENQYKKALKLDKNSLQAYQNLGLIYYRQNRYKQSQQAYISALKINPDSSEVYNNLGILYSQRTRQAQNAYKKALKLNPQSHHALFNLALLNYNQGNLKQSLAYINFARDFSNQNKIYIILKARILYRLEMFVQAFQYLEQLLLRNMVDDAPMVSNIDSSSSQMDQERAKWVQNCILAFSKVFELNNKFYLCSINKKVNINDINKRYFNQILDFQRKLRDQYEDFMRTIDIQIQITDQYISNSLSQIKRKQQRQEEDLVQLKYHQIAKQHKQYCFYLFNLMYHFILISKSVFGESFESRDQIVRDQIQQDLKVFELAKVNKYSETGQMFLPMVIAFSQIFFGANLKIVTTLISQMFASFTNENIRYVIIEMIVHLFQKEAFVHRFETEYMGQEWYQKLFEKTQQKNKQNNKYGETIQIIKSINKKKQQDEKSKLQQFKFREKNLAKEHCAEILLTLINLEFEDEKRSTVLLKRTLSQKPLMGAIEYWMKLQSYDSWQHQKKSSRIQGSQISDNKKGWKCANCSIF